MNAQNTTITVKNAAVRLNVTPVRVYGLIKAGTLVKSAEGVTVASVEAYELHRNERAEQIAVNKAARAEKSTGERKNSKQYIVELTVEQVEQLAALGFELKPRFVYKAKGSAVEAEEVEVAAE